MRADSVVALCTALACFVFGPAAAQEQAAHARLMSIVDGSQIAPFETDGCSGGMSEIWGQLAEAMPSFRTAHGETPPWEACCVTHDRAYHDAGGATDATSSYNARLAADDALRACVIDTSSGREEELAVLYGLSPKAVDVIYRMVGAAMYHAVRAGGRPCTGLPWRWGYGWPDC